MGQQRGISFADSTLKTYLDLEAALDAVLPRGRTMKNKVPLEFPANNPVLFRY